MLLAKCDRVLPPPLPDNSRGQGTKRRRKNNALDPRKLLLVFALVSCIATMMLLYSRISTGLPLESNLSPGEHDHLLKSETLTLGVGRGQ